MSNSAMHSAPRPNYGLPVELYRPIFEQIVSSKDLCALSRTSRCAQVEAERLLYSHIEGRGITNVIFTCKRICNTARVGCYVRSIELDYSDEAPFGYYQLLHSFYTLVAQALYRTPNLLCLHIRSDMARSFEDILFYFPTSKLWGFQLRRFWISNVDYLTFNQFLPNQRDIRYLDASIIDSLEDDKIPSHFLPRLSCLKTRSYETMTYFLTKRPITHLYTTLLFDWSLGKSLQGAGSKVRAFHCTFAAPEVPELFPRLELLSFYTLLRHIDGQVEIELCHYDDWAIMKQLLSRLKHLQRLAFIYTDDCKCDIADVVAALTALHNVCPTLQFVQLRSPQYASPDELGKPTVTYPRDWEWDGTAWVTLPMSESLDIWEQSAIQVAMSGIPG